jgi:YD repeat-containing protein
MVREMDSGPRWLLSDTNGNLLYRWDVIGNRLHTVYDALRRPLQNERMDPSDAVTVFERTVYGIDPVKNQVGQPAIQYDGSGRITDDLYDFQGNLLSTTRTFAVEYVADLDWSAPPAVPLEGQSYTSRTTYDALNRPTANFTPDGSVTTPSYSESGLLSGVQVSVKGAPAQPFINRVEHDAKLQRTRIDHSKCRSMSRRRAPAASARPWSSAACIGCGPSWLPK